MKQDGKNTVPRSANTVGVRFFFYYFHVSCEEIFGKRAVIGHVAARIVMYQSWLLIVCVGIPLWKTEEHEYFTIILRIKPWN